MAPDNGNRCNLEREGMAQDCLECEWRIGSEQSTTVYTSNELVYGSGVITCNPGEMGDIRMLFLCNETLVSTLRVSNGQSTMFTIVGFDQVQILGRAEVSGRFLFYPRYSPL
ncbi:S-Ena type endospore appendage [Paenibacillus sp. 1P07SE]|uniref:S-Ena type endospore appendage n=1 Tax=Paenibacillus sp. 1P07SE TaxID=3132209 RepID=UPI0039A506EA